METIPPKDTGGNPGGTPSAGIVLGEVGSRTPSGGRTPKKYTYKDLKAEVEDLEKRGKKLNQKQKDYADLQRIQELLLNPTPENIARANAIIQANPRLIKNKYVNLQYPITNMNFKSVLFSLNNNLPKLKKDIREAKKKLEGDIKDLKGKIKDSDFSKANKNKLLNRVNAINLSGKPKANTPGNPGGEGPGIDDGAAYRDPSGAGGGVGGDTDGGAGGGTGGGAGGDTDGGAGGGTGGEAGGGTSGGTGGASTVPIAGVSSVGPGAGTSAEDLKAHLKAAVDNLKKTIDLVENNYTETQNYDKFIITENCKMSSTNIQNMINLLA